MIVIDASAIIAILENESDATVYAEAIAEAESTLLSAATLIEIGIVMVNRRGPKAIRRVNVFVAEAGIEVENVTSQHAQIAIDAFARYGKGQKNKAGLNFGDCFSYALAKSAGLPLLFKGNDFSKTDLVSVL